MRFLNVPGLPLPRGEAAMPADEPTLEERIEAAQHRIVSALAALRGARAAYEHCPSAGNQAVVDSCERVLDRRLGELTELHKAEEALTQ